MTLALFFACGGDCIKLEWLISKEVLWRSLEGKWFFYKISFKSIQHWLLYHKG